MADFKQLGNKFFSYPKLIRAVRSGAISFLMSLISLALISSLPVAVFSFSKSIYFSVFSTVSLLKEKA